MVSKIEISHKTIIFILILLAFVWLVLQIRDILFLLFIAFIVMAALRPAVDWLDNKKVPRFIGAFLMYILVFGVIGLSLAGIIPSLVVQFTKLTSIFPAILGKIVPYWNIDMSSITQQLAPIGENVLKLTIGIFSNIVTTFMVLVFAFYFLLERKYAHKFISGFLGEEQAGAIIETLLRIEQRLGSWVGGQLILMLSVGILSYIGLVVLGIEFALPLAIVAGILEIIPTIGPVVSSIPAIIVALSISPLYGLYTAILYIVIQQLENNILVPLIMKRSVGLHPLVTIVSLLVGARLGGIVGAILAVPTLLIIQELITSYTTDLKK
ncbi:MAG: AI-2E family transporter [Nanoarchaeota archaeon]|nr:AI-2E family transporter [Nanoarchaeota archaeon]